MDQARPSATWSKTTWSDKYDQRMLGSYAALSEAYSDQSQYDQRMLGLEAAWPEANFDKRMLGSEIAWSEVAWSEHAWIRGNIIRGRFWQRKHDYGMLGSTTTWSEVDSNQRQTKEKQQRHTRKTIEAHKNNGANRRETTEARKRKIRDICTSLGCGSIHLNYDSFIIISWILIHYQHTHRD